MKKNFGYNLQYFPHNSVALTHYITNIYLLFNYSFLKKGSLASLRSRYDKYRSQMSET